MTKPVQKYIDNKMVKKIKEIQNEERSKDKVCSFVKASKILAGRI